jgi:hypothetical protein
LNPEKVLEMIPSVVKTAEAARHLDKALLQRLEIRRFGDPSKKRPRGQKVPAGQSYTDRVEDEEEDTDDTDEDELDEMDENEVNEDENEVNEDNEDEFEDEVEAVLQGAEAGGLPDELPEVCAGSYVVAVYEGQWFLAEVCRDQSQVKDGYTKLEYMAIKGTNAFTQPSKPDLHITLDEDIILKNVSPEPVNSRGCLGLSKKDLSKVLSLMVVVFLSSSFSFFIYPPLEALHQQFPYRSSENWKIIRPLFSGNKCLKIFIFVSYICIWFLCKIQFETCFLLFTFAPEKLCIFVTLSNILI